MTNVPNPWIAVLNFSGLGGEEMFDWLSPSDGSAITLLKRDHDAVKELFDHFEKAEHRTTKTNVAKRALQELRIHAALEEEIFYPAVREHMPKSDMDALMNEADEEHHVAKVLVAELESMQGNEDHFDAKFTVLAENVRHHIKEEEHEMFPKVKDLQLDLDALGKKMEARKHELKSAGAPPTPEDRMVSNTRRRMSPRKPSTTSSRKPSATKSRAR